MKIEFSDTFLESLEKIAKKERWWYKLWDTFRYDIPRFFRNIIKFRKELYQFYDWDWNYSMAMFRRGIELDCNYIEEKGIEVDSSRLKKVAAMRRAIQLMKWHENDYFMELAEEDLGYEFRFSKNLEDIMKKEDEETERINSLIVKRAREIENETWDELFMILKGQDNGELNGIMKIAAEENEGNSENSYDDWFDGTGVRGWWD